MKKTTFKFMSIIALLLIACVGFTGCGNKKDDGKELGLMIGGKSFYYLSDDKLASYKETVTKLLENERPSEYDVDFDGNTTPPYSDRPSIEEGYSCALLTLLETVCPSCSCHLSALADLPEMQRIIYTILSQESCLAASAAQWIAHCAFTITRKLTPFSELIIFGFRAELTVRWVI